MRRLANAWEAQVVEGKPGGSGIMKMRLRLAWIGVKPKPSRIQKWFFQPSV